MEKNYLYFHDVFADGEEHLHGIKNIITEIKTPYQFIQLVESSFFGKMLIIDGDVQSSVKDEYIYHESLVHPAMLLHPNPKNIILLGGGEGATLREVLKHKDIKNVFMLDIDKDGTELAKKYLWEWHQGSFENPKTALINTDARKFIESQVASNSTDIIISDLTEPFEAGPSYKLCTKEFFALLFDRLSEDGIFALQASMLRSVTYRMHRAIRNTLMQIFPVVRSYYVYVPSFDTTWSFVLASKKYNPKTVCVEEIDEKIQKRIKGELKFYEGEAHTRIFSLPKDIKKILAENTEEIITDVHPLPLTRKENI
jgi:spermidine synthase